MLRYMLDTNICIHVIKNYPIDLRDKFNALAEQLCISSITLGELHFGVEKSARRIDNLKAPVSFVARLDVLLFDAKATAHYGQLRAELEKAGTPCGPHDMQIGGGELDGVNRRERQMVPASSASAAGGAAVLPSMTAVSSASRRAVSASSSPKRAATSGA